MPTQRFKTMYSTGRTHVIDWLVRKPGAFAAYRHRDAMFPTSRFRRAYDVLLARGPAGAAKDYLRILELAAKGSEAEVDAVLGRLLDGEGPITPTVIAEQLGHELGLPRATEVVVTPVDLSLYDQLLETGEDIPLVNQLMYMGP